MRRGSYIRMQCLIVFFWRVYEFKYFITEHSVCLMHVKHTVSSTVWLLWSTDEVLSCQEQRTKQMYVHRTLHVSTSLHWTTSLVCSFFFLFLFFFFLYFPYKIKTNMLHHIGHICMYGTYVFDLLKLICWLADSQRFLSWAKGGFYFKWLL